MNLGVLKIVRNELNFSQQEVASKAGISLATYQTLEAKMANPSLSTLEKIAKVLGLELTFSQKRFSLSKMIKLGVPLFLENEGEVGENVSVVNTNDLQYELIDQLNCIQTNKNGDIENLDSRSHKAIEAFLLAIFEHYPTFFKIHLAKNKNIERLLNNANTGEHIKLKRIALARVSEYL